MDTYAFDEESATGVLARVELSVAFYGRYC